METVAPILDAASNYPYLSVVSVVLGCAAFIRFARGRRSDLPPGPKGYPIVGNIFDLPPTHLWEKFSEFGKQYGDIIYLNVVGQEMIILNSSKAAVDLLDKKSPTYSNRPVLTMCGDIIGWNKAMGLIQYGPRFREFRKYLNKSIGTRAGVEKFAPLQEKETAKFVARVMVDPDSLVEQIQKSTGAIILMIAYGYSIKENDDPYVKVLDAAVTGMSETANPGAFLVDTIPSLQYVPDWFPGTGWKVKAKLYKKLLNEMVDVPFQFVKNQMAAGTAVPSYTSLLLESEDITPETEDNIKWTAASLCAGGAETTVSAIYSFYLAMMMYPEVLRKAQAEIDRVIGSDRFPTFADQANLPYVDAVAKEVVRWGPVVPLGLPHVPVEDDYYMGYLIPKGSLILVNIWQILRDPATYENPMEFNPERFLGDNPEPDPRGTMFGFGRRICPGINVAQTSIWIACAMSLAVFDVEKYVDGSGNVVEPEIRYTNGVISQPPPFKCIIKPRSEKSAALVGSIEF